MKITDCKKKILYLLALILISISIFSIFRAFQSSLLLSIDFQYSPTKLLLEGINHYQYVLDGKHDNSSLDKIMKYQNGEYGHALYVMLLPFAALSWDNAKILWSITNIILSIIIPILLSRKFNLKTIDVVFVCCLYLSSTIFRINIGWGQQTTLIFFFFILPFIFQNKISIFFAGFCFVKYNIGYALFIYFIYLRKINYLFLIALPCFFGWILYSFLSQTPIFTSLFQPLLVVKYLNLTFSFPFFMSFLTKFGINIYIVYFLSILFNIIIIKKIFIIKNNLLRLSLLCLSILIFVPHSIQDYILLLPLLIFSIKNIKSYVSKISLIVIFYFYFGLFFISKIFNVMPWEFTRTDIWGHLNIFILLAILIINYFFYKNNYYLNTYKNSDEAKI